VCQPTKKDQLKRPNHFSKMDDVQLLRSEMINESSLSTYLNTIVAFIVYLYNLPQTQRDVNENPLEADTADEDTARIHDHVNELLESQYVCPLDGAFREFIRSNALDNTPAQLKRMIKAELRNHQPPPVMEFDKLTEIHFVRFALSLIKSNGHK
jgi:hypothetical protein